MSVLNEVDLSGVAAAAHSQEVTTFPGIPDEARNAVRSAVASVFWEWFELHKGQAIAHVHFWLFSREVKVDDLREVFTLLFGPQHTEQQPEVPQ